MKDLVAFKQEYRKDMQRIDVRLNGTNERLDSFKFDSDFLIENIEVQFSRITLPQHNLQLLLLHSLHHVVNKKTALIINSIKAVFIVNYHPLLLGTIGCFTRKPFVRVNV